MVRLCEDCGFGTGLTFYVVTYQPNPLWSTETAEKAVCGACAGKYQNKREVTETPEQLAALERRMKAAFGE